MTAMKKKNKKVIIAGIGALPLSFLFFLVIIIAGVSSSAAGSTSSIASDQETMNDYYIDSELALNCLFSGNEYEVEYYKILWYFIATGNENATRDETDQTAQWLSEHPDATDEEIISHYKDHPSLGHFTEGDLLQVMEMSKEIMSITAENNEGTKGSSLDIEMNVESSFYQNGNPFTLSGYRGQCTWYCWGRAMEVAGVEMPLGNAQTWYAASTLSKGQVPSVNAVAVFAGGTYGHVVFIEAYDGETITYSEGNYPAPETDMYLFRNFNVEYARLHYKELIHSATVKVEEFASIYLYSGRTLVGYIYTNKPD